MAKLTQEEVEKRLLEILPHVKLAGQYMGQMTLCRFYDTIVGDYFYAKPKNIFRGHTTGHPSLSRMKQEETNLKRYGAKCSLQNQEVKERIKETNLQRYGVVNPSQSEAVKEKKRETSLAHYGTSNVMQHPEVQNRFKESYLSKTGFTNPFNNPDVMVKAKDTSLKKYGVAHPMQNYEVQQKRKETFQSKYGCDFPSQHPDIRERQIATLVAAQRAGSKDELELLEWLRSLGIDASKSYLKGKRPCEIDMLCVLPTGRKVGIEFNGDYWHSEANNIPTDYHSYKTRQASAQGIELIHIFQSEWQRNKDLIKCFIKAKLGKCKDKIHARKCSVREVPKEVAFEFFKENHLQGKPHLHMKTYGLYHDNVLVAAASFSKPHRQNIKDIQMSRFANRRDSLVVGGLSKLCRHAYKELGEFVSFVHLRLGLGNAYYKAGFTYVSTVRPDYWYWDSNKKKIVTKQARKKSSVHTPEGMTEHEHALQDGLFRVYDSGKLKFLYRG